MIPRATSSRRRVSSRLATALVLLCCSLPVGCRGEPAGPGEGKAGQDLPTAAKGGDPSKFSKENWQRVKPGMSREEVTEIVGPPTRDYAASGIDFLIWEFSE